MILYSSEIHARAVSMPTGPTLASVASVPVRAYNRLNSVQCCKKSVSLSASSTSTVLSTTSRSRVRSGPACMVLASVQEPGRRPHQQLGQAYRWSSKQSITITAAPGVTAAGRPRGAVADARMSEVCHTSVGQEFDPCTEVRTIDNRLTTHAFKHMRDASNSSAGAQYHSVTPGCFASVSRAQPSGSSDVFRLWYLLLPLCSFASIIFMFWLETRASQTTERPLAAADVFASIDQQTTAIKIAAPVTAPGAGAGPAEAQLAKQFRDLMRHPIPGVSAAPDDENPLVWHVRLAGPEGTPYAGGWFNVELRFDENFPGTRPQAAFQTKIWHPNVDQHSGLVCVDIGGEVCSVGCVLSALQQLLKHPNPDAPRRIQCAYEMLNCPKVYEEKARRMTREYAMH